MCGNAPFGVDIVANEGELSHHHRDGKAGILLDRKFFGEVLYCLAAPEQNTEVAPIKDAYPHGKHIVGKLFVCPYR